MNIQSLLSNIATLGPIGLVRGGGTVASLCTLPMVSVLAWYDVSLLTYVAITIGVFFLALFTIRAALPIYQGRRDEDAKDPGEIVIDEVLGCLIAFTGVSISWHCLVWGFLIFRVLDVKKPFGIKRIEYVPGMWGIVLDDMAAGLMTCFILLLIGY